MNDYSNKRLFDSWYIKDFSKPIGSGSFGTVYELCSYDSESVHTAVKIISLPRSQEEYNRRLTAVSASEASVNAQYEHTKNSVIREIELMLKVSGYTNCVGCKAYKVVEHEEGYGWDILIQMELLDNLDAYYRRKGKITVYDVIKLGIDMCSALEACEEHNIIHRDIKPANILVKTVTDSNGKEKSMHYKLGDFGVARVLNGEGTMTISGTYEYMAPELLVGDGADRCVDIYSLGMVMYELLNANRLPFLPNYPENVRPCDEGEARKKCIKGEKKPEPQYVRGTELAKVVLKACEHDRSKRYASASELRKDLEKAMHQIEDSTLFSVPAVGPYEPIWPVPELSNKKIKNLPKKHLAIFAAAAVAVLIAAAAIFAFPGKTLDLPKLLTQESAETAEYDDSVQITITLTPDDDASFADVKHDAPIIKERVNTIYSGSEVDVDDETGIITLTMPLDALGAENDIDTVIRAVINRPMQLYFIKINGYSIYYEESAFIDGSDIVEMRSITAKEASEQYGMPLVYGDSYDRKAISEEQPCILIQLTEECMKKAAIGDLSNEGTINFAADLTYSSSVSFPYTYECGDGATFIAVPDDWSEENLTDALIYGYTHEKVNKGYYFNYEISPLAYWETELTAKSYGDKQCAYDELTGDTVTLRLEYSGSDISDVRDANFTDVMQNVKNELDIIGLPYAIGQSTQGEKVIIVSTSPEKLNLALLDAFAVRLSSTVRYVTKYYDIDTWDLETKSMEIVKNGNDSYALEVEFDDEAALQKVITALKEKGKDENIYIRWGYDDNYILAASVEDGVKKGKLRFTSSPSTGQSKITEEYKYILELEKYIFEDYYSEYSYCVEDYAFSGDDVSFGISTITSEEKAALDNILSLHPSTEAWIKDEGAKRILYVQLNIAVGAGFLDKAFDLTETIFDENDLDSSTFSAIYVQLIEETDDTRCRLVFQPSDEGEYMDCTTLCYGDWLDAYSNEFNTEVMSREFFTKREEPQEQSQEQPQEESQEQSQEQHNYTVFEKSEDETD